MFDADTVRLLMLAAVERERHGMLAADTSLLLDEAMCCDDCTAELLDYALSYAL